MTRLVTTLDLYPERVLDPWGLDPARQVPPPAWRRGVPGRAVDAALAAHVAERLGLRPGQRVLSVGEGEGDLAAALAALGLGLRVVGVDVDPLAVATARRLHATSDRLRFEVASTYALGDLEPADAVVCASTLCFLEDPGAALAELVGRVRPGGALYVLELRRDADGSAYLRQLDAYESASSPAAPAFRDAVRSAWTTGELAALLSVVGPAEVGPVELTPAAAAAFDGHAPGGGGGRWAAVQSLVHGLWHEGLVRPGPDPNPSLASRLRRSP